MRTLTHKDLDQRLIRMHEVTAARLREDPSLIEAARATMARWQRMGITPWTLEQWAQLLDGPREGLLAALVADTQEMRQLRQSSPFAGTDFIDNPTRWRIIKEFRDAAQRREKGTLHFSDSGATPPPENVRMQALKAQHRPEDYTPPASVETPPEEWVVDGWAFEGWLARVSQAPPGKQAAPPETPAPPSPEEPEPPEMSP